MRRFEGWEPSEETVYVYDGGGRLVSSTTTRETEWDEQQQGWMLALAYWRAGLCRRCHGELEQTASPLHEADNPKNGLVYKRVKLTRCHKCTASMRSEHEHAAELSKIPRPMFAEAVIHHVELVERKPRG